ncbi:MAG: nucleotidyltransferase family protein [Pseudobutyrivibrio sp.]|nr:nucleotidyltransferase family protein [Pseudobutyrivibrio sp.]
MVVGIVAEYNPFHNGHRLQIDYARKLNASQIIVAMSGSFTQRGEIACFDKYTRAKAALVGGADIIFEIPTIFATASAREFAAAGVRLLYNTGVVDTILFSAESNDKDMFIASAKKLVELESSGELDEHINSLVSEGKSYAFARAAALKNYLPEEILSSPNNILGLEYCRYIFANNLNLDINIMKRQGNNYNDLSLSGQLSSASAIRQHYKIHHEYDAVSDEAKAIYEQSTFVDSNDISAMLHYKLLTTSDFSKYLDCTSDLSDRIKNNLKDYVSFGQFCELLKTKNMEYSRISRVLCHILLDITEEDFTTAKDNGYITYLRMLGFSKNGSHILSKIKENGKCTILTSPDVDIIYPSEILSSEIYNAIIIEKTGASNPNEFTRKFDLVNL